MKLPDQTQGFLSIYAAALTVVLVLFLTAGGWPQERVFEEITVERINIVEPDGTPRMVLSSRARFPGLILNREEYEHPNRSTAGMLFFNDEGSEQGGLVFGGETDEEGNVSAYGHLSFDQYEQDQVITLNATESGPNRKAGISVWDRPDFSMEELMILLAGTPDDERREAVSRFFADHEDPQPRMYIGKSHSGAVSVRLNDQEGRERLILEVDPDGSPALRMLGEDGEEVARFPDGEPASEGS